ncbi:MAG: hypothetical protein COV91_01415 [Candidatus Taylorbacteria bacterium CG11_big_fil_rev_8_21_14_0_20_46_11]|uniref:Type I restriction modification DNA specificity domain-containing protein n=1 Tax=Candidatus Taylorbacteria bacterium CG11_big_fil_rev_8_21_14_0_20_46_11 TaxID=1975025 RepID=A0A2H0KCL4_9BACT|nr:MAG: hypothetical protein COV91_01415 [Candidatus Taylorbacteria bacterium CG11_big_fil_rev_8_21_14_0_20_46_11]
MTTFQKVKLGDLIEKKIKVEIKKGLEYSFVPMENVSPGSKYPKTIETKVFTGSGSKFADSDTLFARITPCLQNKKIAKVKNLKNGVGFGSTEFFILRAKKDLADSDYLHYITRQDDLINTAILSMTGASGRQRANMESINEFEVEIPDLPTQTRIASVLSAYDDLIENNEKRIKRLEEMAQLLYTEWFVKFKFPGYEKVKMLDSGTEYGKIPEGWEVKKLNAIGKAVTGKTPPTGNLDNFDGEVLFIKTPDIHGNIFVIKTEQTLSSAGSQLQASKLLPEKTVFVSCIGTLGVVGITAKPSQTNQQINALVLNDKSDYIFFYFFAKSLKPLLIGLGSNGATMGNVNKDKFENIQLLYPDKKTRQSFFDRTSEMFDEMLTLQQRNEILSQTRDLLIPQLVTGKRELK